jgi:hypothetical protein
MLGNSWGAAQVAASQEGLSSMSEWVSDINHIGCIASNYKRIFIDKEDAEGSGGGLFILLEGSRISRPC